MVLPLSKESRAFGVRTAIWRVCYFTVLLFVCTSVCSSTLSSLCFSWTLTSCCIFISLRSLTTSLLLSFQWIIYVMQETHAAQETCSHHFPWKKLTTSIEHLRPLALTNPPIALSFLWTFKFTVSFLTSSTPFLHSLRRGCSKASSLCLTPEYPHPFPHCLSPDCRTLVGLSISFHVFIPPPNSFCTFWFPRKY